MIELGVGLWFVVFGAILCVGRRTGLLGIVLGLVLFVWGCEIVSEALLLLGG